MEINNFQVGSFTTTSFKLYCGWFEPYDGNTVLWICICKQQWGTSTGFSKDTNVTVNFPISFSTVGIATSQSVPASSSWSYAQVSVSKTSMVVQSQGIYRERVWWLAMGY